MVAFSKDEETRRNARKLAMSQFYRTAMIQEMKSRGYVGEPVSASTMKEVFAGTQVSRKRESRGDRIRAQRALKKQLNGGNR